MRSAHGGGVGVRLDFAGGPGGGLWLSAARGGDDRWVERALLPAYGPGHWRIDPVDEPTVAGRRCAGHRPSLPGERGSGTPEPGGLALALRIAMGPVGTAAALRVTLVPAPQARRRLWDAREPPELPARPVPRAAARRPPGPLPPGRDRPVHELEPIWRATIELWTDARRDPAELARLRASIGSAWSVLDGVPLSFARRPPWSVPGALLSERELLALLPSTELGSGSSPTGILAQGGLPLGRASDGGSIGLPVEPDQGRHFAILGETGIGKSSLLVTLAVRASKLGGLVLLDPLGETAEAVRGELARAGRRVRWIAPGATGAELNALGGIGELLRTDPVRAQRELEALVQALRRVRSGRYVEAAYWGPRLEEMLRRAVRAAAAIPGGTLEDAHALLAGAERGRTVVPSAALADARELAARIRDRPDDAEGARRLLYEIVRDPTLVRSLCSREPSLSIAELLQPGRLVLVSGAASEVGETTARYLLASLLALVWSGLLARREPSKTFVMLDEAQWFAHEGLAEMLRLARRRNVHVGLATQSLAGLADEVREALRTNVADLVVFRGSPDEARELARTTTGTTVEELLRLPRGTAVAFLGKGETVRWVRTARLPDRPVDPPVREEPAVSVGGPTPELGPAVELERLGGARGLTAEAVLASLQQDLAELEPGRALEVDARRLFAQGEDGELELRKLGGELGRRGAIVRRERREGRPIWWLAPGPGAPAPAGSTRDGQRGDAERPQRL